ncbi:hypothetical protein Glove_19g295 [Diversispora epigaea]|uniref:Uncharacterized protein n=1 Tax=Diversispora epigaea TaxID=1348612 RepID=A0A397JV19_9GLOM|nr:hypothetical protein Glove_19g295 [Diversispora epigaea]
MARTNEKSSQEWYYVDLIAKILDDKFPFSTPLDPFVPKDENEAAIAKAKAAEYTEKARRAAYISVEYVQRDRRKLNKTEISIIKTDRRVSRRYSPYISSPLNDTEKKVREVRDRRVSRRYSPYISSPLNDTEKKVREVRGKISKAYVNTGRRSALTNNNEEVVDVGDDGVINIHAPEVDDKDIDVVNTDWELDTNYTEARKLELFRWDLCNIHAPEVDDKDIDVVNTDWELDTNYTEARKLELFRWDLWSKQKYKH